MQTATLRQVDWALSVLDKIDFKAKKEKVCRNNEGHFIDKRVNSSVRYTDYKYTYT